MPSPSPKAGPQPFAVSCSCGEVRHGERLLRPQVLTCPRCGRKLFVLPRSPWPVSEEELVRLSGTRLRGEGSKTTAKSPHPSPWRQPLLAAGLSLLVAGIGIGALIAYFGLRPKGPANATVQSQLSAALHSLSLRDVRTAQATLQTARAEVERTPDRFPRPEVERLQRLERQVHLLANFVGTSLEEMLVEARGSPANVWAARFAERYVGRTIAFDARIGPGPAGECRIDYVLEAEGTPGRISVADFRATPARFNDPQPRRWLLGGRLASFKLEADAEQQPGQWVVRFQPDSLVLLTEPAVAAYLGLSADAGLLEILREQRIEPAMWIRQGLQPGDGPELVQRLYGVPDRVSRQFLADRHIAQWTYARQPLIHINLAHPFGRPAGVARLGPAQPR